MTPPQGTAAAREQTFDPRPAAAGGIVVTARPASSGRSATPATRIAALAVKHAADRAVALLLLAAVLPLLAVIAAGVALSSPGPVLFRQRRIGLDGRAFDILKFRSMVGDAVDASRWRRPGAAPGGVEGADRRTRLGRVLRRTSLDELPQLLNVLRGEMSLVGPRPERPEFVQLFADEIPGYADRHLMRAGITGLAQVRGLRGPTSIAGRAAADLEYIERWSLLLDLGIVLRTFAAVLRAAE